MSETNSINNLQVINVLWTGGVDSTFRIMQLSTEDVVVQPYYILDRKRASLKKELQAMAKLAEAMKAKPSTRFQLREVIMVERDDIQPDETIGNAYKVLFDKYRLGSQYEWLASFAKQKDLSLEICIEKTPGNKKRGCRKTIREEGALVERGEGVTRTYAIDPEKASAEVAVVFENLRFPADLWNMEKTVELDCIHQMNMDDLIPLTWFCNRPVLGMPCGRCNPCIDATSEGMGYRIPFMGRVLGHLRHFTIDCVHSVWGRLFR